jgi:uncharacterized protein (TIGR02001 family)
MQGKQFISLGASGSVGAGLKIAVAMLLVLTGSSVLAQTSGSVSIISDYRYRGVSLSEGRPVAQINLGYDSPGGWYAGGFASSARLDSANTEQLIAYAGYTDQFSSGLSWEAGASNALFLGVSRYNYAEAFAGLTSDNFSGRIYFSPNYFGQNARTMYAEINGAYPFLEKIHLLAHIGLLHSISSTDGGVSDAISRFDSRLGVSASVADWNAQLAWVVIEKSQSKYSHYEDRNPRALVLSLSYAF